MNIHPHPCGAVGFHTCQPGALGIRGGGGGAAGAAGDQEADLTEPEAAVARSCSRRRTLRRLALLALH